MYYQDVEYTDKPVTVLLPGFDPEHVQCVRELYGGGKPEKPVSDVFLILGFGTLPADKYTGN